MLQMRVSNMKTERRDEGLVSENIPLSLSVLRGELPHIPEDQQTDDLQPPGHPQPQWHSREPRKVHSNWEHQTLLIEFAGTFYLLELVRSFYFSFCLFWKCENYSQANISQSFIIIDMSPSFLFEIFISIKINFCEIEAYMSQFWQHESFFSGVEQCHDCRGTELSTVCM